MSWYEEARERPLSLVAQQLGLSVRRDRLGPCPACGELRERAGARMAVGILRGGAAWTCNRCHISGDALDLVSLSLLSRPARMLDKAGWNALRIWYGLPSPAVREARVEPAPDWPPQREVTALWHQFLRLQHMQEAERELRESAGVVTWLGSRGIDVDLVAALDMVRVAPAKRTASATATGAAADPAGARPDDRRPDDRRPESWGWPWVAAMPLFDATGARRSLLFRAVVKPPASMPGKSLALRGYARAGLVLADPMGVALLGGRTICGDTGWDGQVLVCEGETDLLTLALHPDRIREGRTWAVIATVGAVTLPAEVGQRIPEDARVLLCPDVDASGKGEQVMMQSRATSLAHVRDVRRLNLRRAA